MAFRHIVFFLFLSVACSYAEVGIPVFLWGDLSRTSIKANPLATIPDKEFFGIVQEESGEDSVIVVFTEESLSVEDLSRRNSDGQSSFSYLSANLGNSIYLPSVDGALPVLNDIANNGKADHVKLSEDGVTAELEGGKFLFINLKDAKEGESRADMLSRHDAYMHEKFNELKTKNDKVVAIYTAQLPSWIVAEHSRVRRQAVSNNTDESDMYLNGLHMYIGKIQMFKDSQGPTYLKALQSNKTTYSNETGVSMLTELVYPEETLTLEFTSSRGYWALKSLIVNDKTYSPMEDVYALTGFSYRCAQNITFKSYNDTTFNVTLMDVQIQPFFETLNQTSMVFGDPFHCVGFFSVPIWAGLFVVFILLAITFYGIMMMMDIRTMDRFDDPKGKTITINAGE